MALSPDSPAVDQGSSKFDRDQRGERSPIDFPSIPNPTGGNGADIGAFELQTLTPVEVTLSPLQFGDQAVETLSRPRELTVRNIGNASFRVLSVKVDGAEPDDFAISSETA